MKPTLEDHLNVITQQLILGLNPFAEVINEAFEKIGDSIRELVERLFDETWERYPDETLIEWGNRLEAMGKLDNPDIRWEYQKAMLLWLVSPIRWIWRKVSE